MLGCHTGFWGSKRLAHPSEFYTADGFAPRIDRRSLDDAEHRADLVGFSSARNDLQRSAGGAFHLVG